MALSPDTEHPLKDCHPEPFESSRVSGAQGYLVLASILVLLGVAIAFLLGLN